MEMFELIIDEEQELNGIQAVSIVSDPAIESDFVALNKEVKLAVVDDEKRILMGAALIPNKPIYRADEGEGYHIFFSEKTVRKASELFFKNGNQSETTLEHEIELKGNTIVESWIKEDEIDKSVKYGIDVPVGTWMISMKIEDDILYKMAKEGKVKGFSIEGYFADKLVKNNKNKNEMDELKDFLKEMKNYVLSLGKEEENPVAEVEVKEEEVVEVKKEETPEIRYATFDELTSAMAEMKSLFSKQHEKFEAEKTELENKNVELKAELDKKPDAARVVHAPKIEEVNLSTSRNRLLWAIKNVKK